MDYANAPVEAAAYPVQRPGDLRRAVVAFAAFSLGLCAILFAIEICCSHYFSSHHGAGLIAQDIYQVVHEDAAKPDARVTTLILGDSVSRQLFRPRTETDPSIKYLTTNQAISVAGQYFLLRESLKTFSNTSTVYFMFSPSGLDNNLDQPWTADYFFTFFHSPGEISDVWQVTHNSSLAVSQTTYLLMPSRAAVNQNIDSYLQPFFASDQSSQDIVKFMDAHRPKPSAAAEKIPASAVSISFLQKIRALCDSRQIKLRILPAPSRDDRIFDEHQSPFDAPIFYLPTSWYVDFLHFKSDRIDEARQAFLTRYGVSMRK